MQSAMRQLGERFTAMTESNFNLNSIARRSCLRFGAGALGAAGALGLVACGGSSSAG